MGLFRGEYYNNDPQNHFFVTNHPAMAYAGLRTFNLNLINQFANNSRLQGVVANAFRRVTGRTIDLQLDTLGQDSEALFLTRVMDLLGMDTSIQDNPVLPGPANEFRLSCQAYDLEGRSFSKTGFDSQQVIDMIKWYEQTWLPSDQDKDNNDIFDADKYRKINSIKNSIEKYAYIERPVASTIMSQDTIEDENVEFLAEPALQGIPYIYLRLYFADKNVLNSSRVVVPKGPPKFVGVPRRATGKKYSHGKSKKEKTGVSVDQEESEFKDPEDAVFADVRMSYNPAINKWEVQNQILARLLTDVDPAPIQSVALDPVDVDAVPPEDFYDVGNSKFLGQFSTGLAMPLSSENGNPHAFGPNLIKCGNTTECEKIRVFNRANKTYTKGQLVICHFIGNEWLIQDFGADLETVPKSVGVGTWQFGKFITSTNTHFREDDPPKQSNGDFSNLQIRPDEWTQILRTQFYNKYNDKTLSANKLPNIVGGFAIKNPDAKLNTCIMQSSIFDQYDNGQQFNKINPAGKGVDPNWDEVCPMYWGPVFNAGYAKNTLSNLPTGANSKTNIEGGYDLISFASMGPSLGSNRESIRSPHLPPEVAVNGPWGKFSSPIDSYHYIAEEVNSSSYNFMTNGSHEHYSYFETSSGTQGSFALKPNDPTQVTFISLACEFAAADDLLAQASIMPINYRNERSFYDKARAFSGVGNVGMGKALTRGNPEVGIYTADGCSDGLQPTNLKDDTLLQAQDDFIDSQNRAAYTEWQKFNTGGGGNDGTGCPNAGEPYEAPISPGNPIEDDACIPPERRESLSTSIQSVRTVPYDYYVKSKFNNAIIGPNATFGIGGDGDNQGAECQGIITARTKLLRSGGGAVTFETVNNFGMVGTVSVFTQEANISVIPLFPPISLGTGGNFDVQPRAKVWGNSEQGPENFGITALHVQIFDYWPPEQTLYIAPYFTILHFNGGAIGDSAVIEEKYFRPLPSDTSLANFNDPVAGTPDEQIIADEGLIKMTVHSLSYEGVDVRVPTAYIGNTLLLGHTVDADTKLRPRDYWNVNTDARGLMLSNGGAASAHFAIGVAHQVGEDEDLFGNDIKNAPDYYNIVDEGEGFDVDQILTSVSKDVMIQVTSTNANGGITGFKFAKKSSEEFSQGNLGQGSYQMGSLEPSDFPLTLSFTSGATGGVTSRIKFSKGMVYRKEVYHRAPERYTPAFKGTRISQSAGDGSQYIRGATKSTSITLEDNSSYHPYPGEYEAFFYFHNDITHTLMGGNTVNSNPYLQYIKLTIS